MTDIVWLDENETEPRKQNFAIRQLLERVPGIEDDIGVLQVPACFSVHKNGTDQTGIADATHTLVTWSNEIYDVGSHFASNTWTPPAGKVSLKAAVYTLGTTTIGNGQVTGIYKNGSPFKYSVVGASAFGGGSCMIAVEDIANGSDAYTVSAYLDVNSGTATVVGDQTETFFMGHWISA